MVAKWSQWKFSYVLNFDINTTISVIELFIYIRKSVDYDKNKQDSHKFLPEDWVMDDTEELRKRIEKYKAD